MLKKFLERQLEKKRKFKEMEENARLQKLLEDKQKSHNERELERFMEERRQQMIKVKLNHFRKQENNEFWHKNMLNQKNMFSQKYPSIMKLKGEMLYSN